MKLQNKSHVVLLCVIACLLFAVLWLWLTKPNGVPVEYGVQLPFSLSLARAEVLEIQNYEDLGEMYSRLYVRLHTPLFEGDEEGGFAYVSVMRDLSVRDAEKNAMRFYDLPIGATVDILHTGFILSSLPPIISEAILIQIVE